MADPHTLLAPLIEPPLSPPPLPPIGNDWPVYFLVAAVLFAGAALAVARMLWRRTAPRRELSRIARMNDPTQAAHRLSALVLRHGMTPPAAWREALDSIRFGLPAPEHKAGIPELCTEASSFFTRMR